MTKNPKQYLKSEFAKNVAVMFSGNGLALVFPLIMGPFISRLYTPQDFAGFELFVKIAALMAVASSLRLEQAIILPKLQSEADDIFKFCIKILLIVTGVSLLISWPFRNQIGELLDNSDLPDLLWLMPLGVFSIGLYQVFTAYAIRLRQFKKMASNKVLAAISNNGFKYLLGLSSPTSFNLVWGQIIGTILPVFAFFQIEKVRESVKGVFKQKTPGKVILKKYRDFPIVNSSHAFFDEGQRAALLFIVSAYHGAIVLGLFAFGWRYLKVPLQVFGGSISQVLNEKWARDVSDGVNIQPAVLKMVGILFLVAIVPFTILFFFGEPIFSFVFGAEWTIAGQYAEVMAPWLMVNFITSPISFLPILANEQKKSFALAVSGNLIILAVVFVMSMKGMPFHDILVAMVAGNAVLLLISLFWFIHISGKKMSSNF